MALTSEQLARIVVVFIAIAGVWMTILTYVLLTRKRRRPEHLVEEIKRALQDDKSKAAIVPLLNEMIEGETNKTRKRKMKTIKSKAKKIDVSDVAELMKELDDLVMECPDSLPQEQPCCCGESCEKDKAPPAAP